jgi:hypothetical protein
MRLRTKHKLPNHVVIPKDPPKRLDQLTLDDLSPRQRHALIVAATQGALPGQDGIRGVTIQALARKDLIHKRTSKKGRTSWRATDTGRYIVAAQVSVFLHKRLHRNYTNDPKHAVPREPEVMQEAA